MCGGADALPDLIFVVSLPDGVGSGSVVYGGATGPSPDSEPAYEASCASGWTVSWVDVAVGAGGSVSFTMTIVYDGLPDGTRIQADLGATFTVDPSDGFRRTVSGAPATIIFTVEED